MGEKFFAHTGAGYFYLHMPGKTLILLLCYLTRVDQDMCEERIKNFLGIYFSCCNLYGRLYRTNKGDRYTGACPGCGKRYSVPIGKGGTSKRFFIS